MASEDDVKGTGRLGRSDESRQTVEVIETSEAVTPNPDINADSKTVAIAPDYSMPEEKKDELLKALKTFNIPPEEWQNSPGKKERQALLKASIKAANANPELDKSGFVIAETRLNARFNPDFFDPAKTAWLTQPGVSSAVSTKPAPGKVQSPIRGDLEKIFAGRNAKPATPDVKPPKPEKAVKIEKVENAVQDVVEEKKVKPKKAKPVEEEKVKEAAAKTAAPAAPKEPPVPVITELESLQNEKKELMSQKKQMKSVFESKGGGSKEWAAVMNEIFGDILDNAIENYKNGKLNKILDEKIAVVDAKINELDTEKKVENNKEASNEVVTEEKKENETLHVDAPEPVAVVDEPAAPEPVTPTVISGQGEKPAIEKMMTPLHNAEQPREKVMVAAQRSFALMNELKSRLKAREEAKEEANVSQSPANMNPGGGN